MRNLKCYIFAYIVVLLTIFILGCAVEKEIINKDDTLTENEQTLTTEVDTMKLSSPAFQNNGNIPSEYTCDGADVSPQLIIGDAPQNAKSLALVMDDPDAPMGTFVHWVAWNIPPETKEIKKGQQLANEGRTDFGRAGYGGPCPPRGVHRYFFKLYALDITPNLPQGATKKDLEKAMQGHILAQAQLMGNYQRSR